MALRAAFALTVAVLTFAQIDEAQGQFGPPAREIVHVKGDVYRANNGNWWVAFLVTPEGIILGDTLNLQFSTWLKEALAERFDVPVRYVVYSHSHFDHAEGGAVFAETATFVAHENMLRNMDGRYPQMPGDMVDRDNNGLIDYDDIMIPTNAKPGLCGMSEAWFRGLDPDGDGAVTPAELQRNIVPPDIVYSESMAIELGGKRVELVHPGLNHSDDATVMLFTDERVLFATEFIADALVRDDIHALPSACGPFDGSPLSSWIDSYRAVEALDFDIVAPGHGAVFEKAGVTATRVYFEDLVAAVSEAMSDGLSLAEMQDTIELGQYADWVNYDRLLRDNIEAAYLNLKLYR